MIEWLIVGENVWQKHYSLWNYELLATLDGNFRKCPKHNPQILLTITKNKLLKWESVLGELLYRGKCEIANGALAAGKIKRFKFGSL